MPLKMWWKKASPGSAMRTTRDNARKSAASFILQQEANTSTGTQSTKTSCHETNTKNSQIQCCSSMNEDSIVTFDSEERSKQRRVRLDEGSTRRKTTLYKASPKVSSHLLLQHGGQTDSSDAESEETCRPHRTQEHQVLL